MEPRAQADRLPPSSGPVHPHRLLRPGRGRLPSLRRAPALTDPDAAHDPVRTRPGRRQRQPGGPVRRPGSGTGARLGDQRARGPGRPGARRMAGRPRPDDPPGAAPLARLRRGRHQYRRRPSGRRTAQGPRAPARAHALPRPARGDGGVFQHHRQGRVRAVPDRPDRRRLRERPQTPVHHRGAASLGAPPAVALRGAHLPEIALRRPRARRRGDGHVRRAAPGGPGDRRTVVRVPGGAAPEGLRPGSRRARPPLPR